MRLLSEYMPVPEINGVASNNGRSFNQQSAIAHKEAASPENRNLQLARLVEAERTKLVNELAKFPVTALLVISQYERATSGQDDHDDEAHIASEFNEHVQGIKKYYQLASRQGKKANPEGSSATAVRRLVYAVQQFPFGFDDLVNIVDIITYAFKLRGLSFQPASMGKKESDAVLLRLQGASRSGKKDLSWHYKILDLHQYDEQFLFLPSMEMNALYAEVVLAEHNWLAYRQQLAAANSKLVLYIANQYKGNFLDFEDLVQEGHTGLLKAVDRFKYRLGFQFSTYAGYWIRQAISRALSRSERVVRIPCGQVATINRVFRAKDEITAKTGMEPSSNDIARYTGLSQDEVNTVLAISQSAVALEAYDEDEEEQSFAPINFIEQSVFTHSLETIASNQLEGLVNAAIKTLNPREAKILCSHFGVGNDRQMTLQEIGAELNLTRERVRQIQVVALNKIRMRYGDQLASFL